MNGPGHAFTGLVAGALVPIALHAPGELVVQSALVTAGAVFIPDLDQPISTASRVFGRPTMLFSSVVLSRFTGPHRWRTHDLLVGPPVVGLLSWLMTLNPVSQLVLLIWLTGLILSALDDFSRRRSSRPWHRLIAAVVLGAAWQSTTPGSWLPLAVAGGCVVHIIGDLGAPLPLPGSTVLRTPGRPAGPRSGASARSRT